MGRWAKPGWGGCAAASDRRGCLRGASGGRGAWGQRALFVLSSPDLETGGNTHFLPEGLTSPPVQLNPGGGGGEEGKGAAPLRPETFPRNAPFAEAQEPLQGSLWGVGRRALG